MFAVPLDATPNGTFLVFCPIGKRCFVARWLQRPYWTAGEVSQHVDHEHEYEKEHKLLSCDFKKRPDRRNNIYKDRYTNMQTMWLCKNCVPNFFLVFKIVEFSIPRLPIAHLQKRSLSRFGLIQNETVHHCINTGSLLINWCWLLLSFCVVVTYSGRTRQSVRNARRSVVRPSPPLKLITKARNSFWYNRKMSHR